MTKNRKPDSPFQSSNLGGSGSKSHANNNAYSINKQGYRHTLRRWFKAFLVFLADRQLITQRFADAMIRRLIHD